MSNYVCNTCFKIVPKCTSCERSLEKMYPEKVNLPFLGYCSENNAYRRYIYGYTDGNTVYCKSCQRTHSNCHQIVTTHNICACEHHIDD